MLVRVQMCRLIRDYVYELNTGEQINKRAEMHPISRVIHWLSALENAIEEMPQTVRRYS